MTFAFSSFRHLCLLSCINLFADLALEGRISESQQETDPHWSSLTSTFPKGFHVQALTVNAEQKLLYIAGTYDDTTFYIKRWNGFVWDNIGDPLNGSPKALALCSSNLYIGGEFTGTLDQPQSLQHIAKYDISTNKWSQVGVGLDNTVLALCSSNNRLYVGGNFIKTNNDVVVLNCITLWDGIKFNQLGVNGAPGVGASRECSVTALLQVGNYLYIGGTFTRDNTGTAINRIAKLDITNNIIQPLGLGFNNGCVNALAFNGSKIIAGGSFNQVNLTTDPSHYFHCGYIAEWDGESWTNLGDFNNPVQAIITNGSKLYAAGIFNKNGLTPIDHIAQYDFLYPSKKWLPLSEEDNGLTKKEGLVFVNALGKWENTLFACGNFDASHKVPGLGGIAVWTDTICLNCLYCGFTPIYIVVRQPNETASCQASVIVPRIPAPFGVELKYFTQLNADPKSLVSWERILKTEMFHDTMLITNLNPGQIYCIRSYSECTFPGVAPKSFSAPSKAVTFGTRTVKAGKIKKTSAEISIGLEATINPASVSLYYREAGTDSWKVQTIKNLKQPNVFRINELHSQAVYEFKAGFTFLKIINEILTPTEVVEECTYTFRTN